MVLRKRYFGMGMNDSPTILEKGKTKVLNLREKIILLLGILFGFIMAIHYAITNEKIHEEIDGVQSIDGITYLIKDTDVSYVMYKLNSTCISRIIKEKKFEVVKENEGILTFGGVNYSLNLRGSENDMNIGAAYRIQCTQHDKDVIMKVSFEKRDFKWWSPSLEQPGLVLNQAYHRFFKEVFDVQVLEQTGVKVRELQTEER